MGLKFLLEQYSKERLVSMRNKAILARLKNLGRLNYHLLLRRLFMGVLKKSYSPVAVFSEFSTRMIDKLTTSQIRKIQKAALTMSLTKLMVGKAGY